MSRLREPIAVGERLEVEVGTIAHGGHCIAHARGRTLLVRHAIPGERVVVEVTDVASKVCRADAVEVISASPDRVTPPCAYATPGGCGGCDFQHVTLDAQRGLKTQVLRDALSRFANLQSQVEVQAIPGDIDGLGWRTRTTWHTSAAGRPGLYAARSHRVVEVTECLIAAPRINDWLAAGITSSADAVVTAVGDSGEVSVSADHEITQGPKRVEHEVLGRHWRIAASGFWQVHLKAAETLVQAVLAQADPRPGERWWDLYAGAGLFSAFIAGSVGESGRVQAVEASAEAMRDARRALHDLPNVTLSAEAVEPWLRAMDEPVDGVVLDPPRTGAGAAVVRGIAEARPARVVYVACDPVALARDIALFAEHGYQLAEIEAFDLFPMTHHMEAVALLTGR